MSSSDPPNVTPTHPALVTPGPRQSSALYSEDPVLATCLVDALVQPEDFRRDSDVVYRDEALVLRHPAMRLVWEMIGDSGLLYESEPLPRPDPDGWNGDRVNGPPQVSDRYVVFYTNDTPEVASPWQIWAWDRLHPHEPPWEIGALPDGTEMSGFVSPQLRGSQVVWSQPSKDHPGEIVLYDLDKRLGRVLAAGVVYAPQLLDDHTVVWQALRPAREYFTTLTGVDLSTGASWSIPHELADIDMGYSGYVATGGLYVLTRDPGDGGASGTYGLVIWRPGWPAAIEIEATEQSAFLSGASQLVQDDLFTYLVWEGDYYTVRVINTRTGVIHEVYRDWAVPRFVGGSLRLMRLLDRETLATGSVEIPASEFDSTVCG